MQEGFERMEELKIEEIWMGREARKVPGESRGPVGCLLRRLRWMRG